MPEREFVIRATLDFEYKVKAESADEAAQMMHDGERIGEGNCVGYGIEAVVSVDKAGRYWDLDEDERAKCAVCGHLYEGHTGSCYYNHQTRECAHPNACDEHGCDCLNGAPAGPEMAEAAS